MTSQPHGTPGRVSLREGDVFGRLTVVVPQRYVDMGRREHSLVRCDCGAETTVQISKLKNGNTKSCGCLRRDVVRRSHHPRLPNEGSVINQLILGYQRHARDRGHDWNLPRDVFDRLVRLPCAYCGDPGSNVKVTKNYRQGFRHNGIDRIDSSRGYESGNVVPCCRVCNTAKGKMDRQQFIAWATRVATGAVAE